MVHVLGHGGPKPRQEAAGLSFHVSPNKHEFAKKIKPMKRPGFAVSGTQCVDRWWRKKGGGILERLMNYVYAFVWRSNLDADVDLTRALGKL